ncbi:MAG TPA: NUDIX hydrolase [Polyangiaceae bacterium]|nr:NUDIX hydrolase [Polyangiaceae bacterium]
MALLVPLPPLSSFELIAIEDLSPHHADGFLTLRRAKLCMRYSDGRRSEPFVFDYVERKALDAVVVAAHYFRDGERMVYLRTAVRPAVALRIAPPTEESGVLWELPAGLVEPDEYGAEGVKRCAARELHEELGFDIEPKRFHELGPSTFPAPGVIGERHYYFHVEVDPQERGAPIEDGSVLEQQATVAVVSLSEALSLVRSGEVEDAKTEIALRRLAEI